MRHTAGPKHSKIPYIDCNIHDTDVKTPRHPPALLTLAHLQELDGSPWLPRD